MSRMRMTIAVLSLAAFAAGLCLGLVLRPDRPPRDRRGHSWLTEALDLSKEQQSAIRAVWQGMGREGWRADAERRRDVQAQRDAAVRALVPPERQDELDATLEGYREAMAEIARSRRAAFEEAVEKTKALLSPEQREQYEAMQARRESRRNRPGPRENRRDGPERPGEGPHPPGHWQPGGPPEEGPPMEDEPAPGDGEAGPG